MHPPTYALLCAKYLKAHRPQQEKQPTVMLHLPQLQSPTCLPALPADKAIMAGGTAEVGPDGQVLWLSTTGAASSTGDSGSGGSGSKGSDSANGSSGATSSSRSGSSIIEGPAPAAGANHDPSLTAPCPVGGSVHPISSNMICSSTSMIQDAIVDHCSTGNGGEDA